MDGKLTRQKKEIVKAFKSHFAEVLNVGSSIPQHVLDGTLPGTTEEKMAEAPSLKEVESAISKLQSGKAAAGDGIQGELLRHGGPSVVNYLHSTLVVVWAQKEIPQQWKDAVIVPLDKKGDRSLVDNYRGISLLSAVGKVLMRVLADRIQEHVDGKLLDV